ncbi:unnamed protein product, partial [marine sediment metagenome]
MATVEITTKREQATHFGLFRASPGGNQSIFVRRKVGEPTDYMHTKSKKVKRQREVFGQASIHYSHLTSLQKEDLKHQVEEVEYIRDHGKSDIKVLQGRALFISKDIHALIETAKQTEMPLTICILSVEPTGQPIDVPILLVRAYPYPKTEYPDYHPYPGTNIFYPVPRLEGRYYVAAINPPLAHYVFFYYSLDQLLKGQCHTFGPYIFEDSVAPYCQRTRYGYPNWHFHPPT